MKFKNYLGEAKQYEPFKKEIIKKFKALIESDYSEAFSSYLKGNEIFRGAVIFSVNNENPFDEFSPKERISANIINIYTPIINEHPSWNKFPKRRVVCSFDINKTLAYGNTYVVFPKNGTKIGICPGNDIWDSFHLLRNKQIDIEYLAEELIRFLDDPQLKFSSNISNKLNPKNLDALKDFSKKIDKKIQSMKEEKWNLYVNTKDFIKDLELQKVRDGKLSLFDVLVSIFSPKGFTTQSIKNLKSNQNSEVWFDNKYLLIDWNFLRVVKNEI